ncbi:MAG: glycosyltransferase family 2 protein [Actinomycetota bacterium]|nr:glycosyltransferase family 2 protein [Actinomycetota bacterium]MDI6821508.1 glycosyltransferase family 2 protein [Actinomycetota bacterium]
MDLVSVIIVNWNGKRFVKDCLDSVLGQTYPALEVIVIDNSSTDGSQEIIKRNYPSVILIENEENKGFSMAINQGIATSKGLYVIPLNIDVVMTPTYISEMVKAASLDEKIGSVSGKLLRFNDEGRTKVIDSVGHTMFENRLVIDRGDGEIDEGQYDQVEYIFGSCAAASLYKRGMLEDVKAGGEYFDEAFFAFLEDVDLNWRAQMHGWKCIYTPSAVAYHYRGGIAVRRTKLVEIHNYKNRYLMILKNDSFASILRNLHHFLITDTLKTGALLFRCPAALLGWIDILRELPRTFAKRRVIQKNRKVSQVEIEKWFQKFDYKAWIRRHLW